MCGISGYIGYNFSFNKVIEGLEMLLNRGYDSVGISSMIDKKILTHKYAGKDQHDNIINLLNNHKTEHNKAMITIGHTRWATHGRKTKINAHPHHDNSNNFSIVHNGIIENYIDLKNELITKYKINILSETDTEIIVNLISVYYEKYKDVQLAIRETCKRLKGTWAVILITVHEPNKLYCFQNGNPLLVGFNKNNEIMISSEQLGFYKYVENYICLEDDVFVIEKKNNILYNNDITKYELYQTNVDEITNTPYPYEHWTLKEIHDQPIMSQILINNHKITKEKIKLKNLEKNKNTLVNIDHLIILGCGTSYHAGLYALNIFREISGFTTVQIFDGGEFTKNDIPQKDKIGIIVISQSGETKDICRGLDIIKNQDIETIGVINVVNSLISRKVKNCLYLNAGREIGVASTKVFTNQIIILIFIAIWFSQQRNLCLKQRKQYIEDINKLPTNLLVTINDTKNKCKEIGEYLLKNPNAFILGRNRNKAIALEGSLKIKELGYNNVQGYHSACLKHGPYSVISNKYPVILLVPNDDDYDKNESVANELISRNAYLIGISDKILDEKYNISIKLPFNKSFTDLLCVIPLQLIAYYLSILKNNNPDRPINLAKTCTTD